MRHPTCCAPLPSNADTPRFPDVVLTNVSAGDRASLAATIDGTADFKNDYTYDDLHRLTRIEQNSQSGGNTVASKRVSFEYNGLGQFTELVRENKPSGSWSEIATSLYGYDDDGRLTSLDHQRSGSDLFTGFDWTYDAMNRITQETSADGTVDYTYDKNNRLTAADYSYQTDETFTYDANGNRTMSGYTIGDANRVLSDGTYDYDYDDDGNIVLRTNVSTGDYTEYVWDHRNRLIQVLEKDSLDTLLAQYDFTYDVFNRRIGQSIDDDGAGAGAPVDTFFLYDGEHVAFSFDGNEDIEHRYLYAPNVDAVLADEDALNAILTPLGNHLGSVTHLVNTTGTVQNHITYGAYGNITAQTAPSVPFLFGFAGLQSAAYGGLSYGLSNQYNPSLGTWATPTPTTSVGAGFNPYSYAHGSPANVVQPSGGAPLTPNPTSPPQFGAAYSQWYGQYMQAFYQANPVDMTPSQVGSRTLTAGSAWIVLLEEDLVSKQAAQAYVQNNKGNFQAVMLLNNFNPLISPALNTIELASGHDFATGDALTTFQKGMLIGGIVLGPLADGFADVLARTAKLAKGVKPIATKVDDVHAVSMQAKKGVKALTTPDVYSHNKQLYAFGNKAGPSPPRAGRDIPVDSSGMVHPPAPDTWPAGKSVIGDVDQAPLTGHYHKIPADTPMPEGLAVIADGVDVGGPRGPTHHTIYPTHSMTFTEFVYKFFTLPWVYGGKK